MIASSCFPVQLSFPFAPFSWGNRQFWNIALIWQISQSATENGLASGCFAYMGTEARKVQDGKLAIFPLSITTKSQTITLGERT